ETSDLTGPSNSKINSTDICCFNTGGLDYLGQAFEKTWEVVPGEVGALWFGLQVPLDAPSGQYSGQITLRSQGRNYPINIVIDVTEEVAADQGMDDPYKLARLKWLNSSLGQEDTITAPYTPLQVSGNTVAALMGSVQFNSLGFPEKIQASNIDVLSQPITMEVRKSRGVVSWKTDAAQIVEATANRVVWESNSTSDEMKMNVVGTMEFDGGIRYDVTFTANKKVTSDTINLNVPLVKEQVPYMSGIGRVGGYRPSRWSWFWSQQPDAWAWRGNNLEYFAWLGDVDAGLYIRLKSPLDEWRNNLNGFVALNETTSGDVLFRAQTGHRELVPGQTIQLSFKLMPTPVKPRDLSIWSTRYAHGHRSMDLLVNSGANVLNIHHSHPGNYWINYPFLNLDTLVPYINEAHGHGIKVKLYYTLRELTTRLPELWAFRSLGDEIYRVGGEQAHGSKELDAWLREHLVDGYAGGWITNTAAGIDPSIRTVRQSRLENFYVEGLAWLLENIKVDGIYLDEIGYTPETIRRVRRVMDAIRPGSMIDVHSHYTAWSNQSPLAYYLEHMPYVDRLWLGEEFNPDNPPEFWLIEMSGIPFGLSNDLLQDPNPWRGMLYGMTPRAEYVSNPKGVWQVWDDFGIDQAVMRGYWENDCPVVTSDKDVLATAYVKEGTTLISLASWAKNDRECRLSIDWDALGLSAEKAVLVAPRIERFQSEATFRPGEPIPVPTGKGWLLILKEE
ncbi:MAG: DUF6067 family protein, partial [Limnochordia bacterium]|nr:DUF6067 family protein [Limnochordia bacterium]